MDGECLLREKEEAGRHAHCAHSGSPKCGKCRSPSCTIKIRILFMMAFLMYRSNRNPFTLGHFREKHGSSYWFPMYSIYSGTQMPRIFLLPNITIR
jgi:hypothetical protein